MRIFQSKAMFDIKENKWVETFKIDGIITDGESYFFEQDREKKLEADKLLKQIELENDIEEIDPCEGCKCRDCCEAEDVEEFDYEDLLDVFVGRILEIGPCPICLRNLLDEFADIFIGDEDEYDESLN